MTQVTFTSNVSGVELLENALGKRVQREANRVKARAAGQAALAAAQGDDLPMVTTEEEYEAYNGMRYLTQSAQAASELDSWMEVEGKHIEPEQFMGSVATMLSNTLDPQQQALFLKSHGGNIMQKYQEARKGVLDAEVKQDLATAGAMNAAAYSDDTRANLKALSEKDRPVFLGAFNNRVRTVPIIDEDVITKLQDDLTEDEFAKFAEANEAGLQELGGRKYAMFLDQIPSYLQEGIGNLWTPSEYSKKLKEAADQYGAELSYTELSAFQRSYKKQYDIAVLTNKPTSTLTSDQRTAVASYVVGKLPISAQTTTTRAKAMQRYGSMPKQVTDTYLSTLNSLGNTDALSGEQRAVFDEMRYMLDNHKQLLFSHLTDDQVTQMRFFSTALTMGNTPAQASSAWSDAQEIAPATIEKALKPDARESARTSILGDIEIFDGGLWNDTEAADIELEETKRVAALQADRLYEFHIRRGASVDKAKELAVTALQRRYARQPDTGSIYMNEESVVDSGGSNEMTVIGDPDFNYSDIVDFAASVGDKATGLVNMNSAQLKNMRQYVKEDKAEYTVQKLGQEYVMSIYTDKVNGIRSKPVTVNITKTIAHLRDLRSSLVDSLSKRRTARDRAAGTTFTDTARRNKWIQSNRGYFGHKSQDYDEFLIKLFNKRDK